MTPTEQDKESKPMTNYNERLDEVFKTLNSKAIEERASCTERNNWEGYNFAYERLENEAKQAITSLIKELVAGAKPEYKYCGFHGGKDSMVDCSACNPENMVDVYKQNLLKALEEV